MLSTRNILFQLHWFLGITAGLVLAVMGVTGALISFEGEILAAINPGVVTVAPGRTPPLPAPVLIDRITAQVPGIRIGRLIVDSDPGRAATVTYTIGKEKRGKGGERQRRFVDPATGQILGEARGEGFFETVENLHRWLALPGHGNGIGRQITGFAALSLIFFALSGLYLRWPRRPLDWRNWLVLDLRKTGRNLYRALHAVIGGWVLAFYLISAGTGLWWSYGWYRDGVQYLLGTERAAAHVRNRRHRSIDRNSPRHREHTQPRTLAEHRLETRLPAGNRHPHAACRAQYSPRHAALDQPARGLDPRSSEIVDERLVHHHVDAVALRGTLRNPSAEVNVHAAIAEAVRHPLHQDVSGSRMPVERRIGLSELGWGKRAEIGVQLYALGRLRPRRRPDVDGQPAARRGGGEHPGMFAHAARQGRELGRDEMPGFQGRNATCSR